MDCKETRLMTHAYVDDELDVLTTARIESHVRTCAMCQQRLREITELRAEIKTAAPYFKAPADLQKRIRTELRKSDQKHWLSMLSDWPWSRHVVAMASIILVSVSLVVVNKMPTADETIARDVISSHVRSLMAEHLTDIRSTDQHTVKPWFTGRLDFSPPVHDLSAQGFALMGGRLDYLENRQAVALVYRIRKHVINLFIWPSAEKPVSDITIHQLQGYQAMAWTQAGMNFWAVSDVNENELNHFAHLIRAVVLTP